jgi:molybdopterin-containing oxidoreductase family iron-sulfur binding subunit
MDERATFARRELLAWAAASATLATSACARAPRRTIVPYATQPDDARPGRALHYATAHAFDGYAVGLVVECHDGRPTKVEGNSFHPASLGASRAFDQALIASLYDPDRARGARDAHGPIAFGDFAERVARTKERVAILLEPTSSRTTARLVARIRSELPNVRVWFDAPFARRTVWDASRAATGRAGLEPLHDFSRAQVTLSFESDFLACGPTSLRDAHDVVARRASSRLRLYAVESRRTSTGAFSDHRVAVGARRRALLARAIASRVLRDEHAQTTDALRAIASAWNADVSTDDARFADAVARDAIRAGAESLVVVGDDEPATLHALAHAQNDALDAFGTTTRFAPSPIVDAGEASFDLADLAARIRRGEVDAVVIVGGNPVYSARSVDFAEALRRTRVTYVGLYENETAAVASTFVPLAHPLESWSDARALDGTASIVQPMIDPIFDGRTVAEILAAFVSDPRGARALVRDAFSTVSAHAWDDALATGVIADDWPSTTHAIDRDAVAALLARWVLPRESPLEISTHASLAAYDGRFANNPWLLELPDPITKLTWGNYAIVSARTATTLDVTEGDVIRAGGARLAIAIEEGTADGVVSIARGFGRAGAESLARGLGANAADATTTITKTNENVPLPRTTHEIALHGRGHEIARARNRSDAPLATPPMRRLSIYSNAPETAGPHAWAMVVDLAACTGCTACVVACQAENNVPIVGAAGVVANRAMHWLRIDRYETSHGLVMQPMLCQQCDEAPCEYVCPVNATVHSPEGLNEMVYNRCVGTRFCSNNCPYKVRRFNWFDYHEDETPFAQLAHNPEVTVRARGVMEKCTFCVQRIRTAEQRARIESRPLRRDEVNTACAQACATGAITFGDLSDPGSAVSRASARAEAYAALDELGTRPRIRYTPKIVDANPELAKG